MTAPPPPRPEQPMTARRALRLAAFVAVLPPLAELPGCGEEEAPPPPPPPRQAAPPPPPPPERIRITALVTDADAPVEFPQRVAPYDLRLGQAVYDLAAAFAAGDDLALSGMLDTSGRTVLDQLVTSGEWFDAADAIETIRVAFLEQTPDENTAANSATVILAVQESSEAYVLGWDGVVSGDRWVFAARETTDDIRANAAAWDSDSIADFLPGSRGAMTGGPSAGPAGFSLEAVLAENPSIAYTTVEMLSQILRISGLSGLEASATQGIAEGYGVTPERLDALVELGREDVRNGERPEPEVIGTFIETARAVADGLGSTVTDNQIIEALAAVFQISEDEARTYFESATP